MFRKVLSKKRRELKDAGNYEPITIQHPRNIFSSEKQNKSLKISGTSKQNKIGSAQQSEKVFNCCLKQSFQRLMALSRFFILIFEAFKKFVVKFQFGCLFVRKAKKTSTFLVMISNVMPVCAWLSQAVALDVFLVRNQHTIPRINTSRKAIKPHRL